MEKAIFIEKLKDVRDFVFKNGAEEEQPVIILGPSGSEKTKLRMYACGGLIGRIPTTKTGKCRLLSTAYKKYLPDSQDEEKWDNLFQNEEQNSLLFSEAYLELAVKAAEARFSKGDKTKSKNPKERNIQTQIVKKYMAEGTGWCVVDMEFRVPKQKKMEKPSQTDIVVFDEEKGFGLIELKYNNESCDNLDLHYNDYCQICSDRKIREKNEAELIRRAGYLADYGLIDSRYYDKMRKIKNRGSAIGFWYGFLFVGGGKNRSADLVKRMGKAAGETKCRFSYVEDTNAIDLRYEKMEGYEVFIKE